MIMRREEFMREMEAELDAMGFQWPRSMSRKFCLDRLADVLFRDLPFHQPRNHEDSTLIAKAMLKHGQQ